jgi:hypothetical protein
MLTPMPQFSTLPLTRSVGKFSLPWPRAQILIILLALSTRLAGNLYVISSLESTRRLSSQLVMVISLLRLVFSKIITLPSGEHSEMETGPLALRWNVVFELISVAFSRKSACWLLGTACCTALFNKNMIYIIIIIRIAKKFGVA